MCQMAGLQSCGSGTPVCVCHVFFTCETQVEWIRICNWAHRELLLANGETVPCFMDEKDLEVVFILRTNSSVDKNLWKSSRTYVSSFYTPHSPSSPSVTYTPFLF